MAKKYVSLSHKCSTVIFGTVCICFYTFQTSIIRIFTSDEKVLASFAIAAPIICVGQFPDLWCGYLSGIVRALDAQAPCVYINFTGFWLVNFPLSLFLTFKLHWGFSGLWWSMITAQAINAVGFQYLVSTADWNKALMKCQERLKKIDVESDK